jgi:radical SAM protein with 4Fe4S-binding SPASM domain
MPFGIQEDLHVDVFGIVPGVFTTEELNAQTSAMYRKKFGINQRYWQGFVRDVSGIDYAAIESQMCKIRKAKWKFRLRIYPPISYSDFSFQEHFCNPRKVFGNVFCATPYVFTQLQPNGDIATCGSQPDYIAGNILQEKFMNIWNGEKYRSFRAHIKKELFPSCPRCWALYEFNHSKDK